MKRLAFLCHRIALLSGQRAAIIKAMLVTDDRQHLEALLIKVDADRRRLIAERSRLSNTGDGIGA
jgi:hypothetical protein